jgi:hypothetical protein
VDGACFAVQMSRSCFVCFTILSAFRLLYVASRRRTIKVGSTQFKREQSGLMKVLCLEVLLKIAKEFSQDSRCPGRDSN